MLISSSSSFAPLPRLCQRTRVAKGGVFRSFSDRSGDTSEPAHKIVIALTREEGKNEKFQAHLTQQLFSDDKSKDPNLEIIELPCIAHADGPDYNKLGDMLTTQHWDYVTITSPEAARVLASAWDPAKLPNPAPSVAAVGKATEETLDSFGIPVDFLPTRALAKVLIQEIPSKSETTTVLYPASAKAKDTLQEGLEERGFAVTRLNTYDTVTATWTQDQAEKAKQTQIVCVASPSSIKGWLKNTQTQTTENTKGILAACIGETSAQACRELGFREEQIFYPEKPGLPGWADAVQDAVQSLSVHHPSSVKA